MKREHVSEHRAPAEITVLDKSNNQPRPRFKPSGLWYGIDGGWIEWCEGNQDDWISGRQVYDVTLGKENMLRIVGLKQLDEFHLRYSAPLPGMEKFDKEMPIRFPTLDVSHFWYINWEPIIEQYDGVEFHPYYWSRHMDYIWYNAWDCASGVVWRPKGIRLDWDRTLPGKYISRKESDELSRQRLDEAMKGFRLKK